MEELKKCPFCPDGIAEKERIFMVGWVIKCRSCGASSPVKNRLEEAIKAWNTRKPMEQIVERLKVLKSEYSEEEKKARSSKCPSTANTYCLRAITTDVAIEIVKEEMG